MRRESVNDRQASGNRLSYGLLLVALAAVLWGTTGVVGRKLIESYHVPALCTAAWRLVIAAPCLMLWEKFSNRGETKKNICKKDLPWFFIYGAAVAAYQLCFFSALNIAPVSVVSIITLCLAPIFVACLAPFLVKEPISRITVIAISLSVIGTVMVIGVQNFRGGTNTQFGYLLAVAAGICYAFYNLCGKKLSGEYPPQYIISRVFSLGALLLVPIIFFTPSLPWHGWLYIVYLGVVPSALAYALFQFGLRTCRATSASIASLLEPLVSTILSVLLLGERFSGVQLLGGVLLINAIVLLLGKQNPQKTNA
ncbi:DMT family transporter [Caproiciproducens sp.]